MEKITEREIRDTYKHCDSIFITHSSDTLNISITSEGNSTILRAKCVFAPDDIITQVRGSIISLNKLQFLLKQGTVKKEELPLLLTLNRDYLIAPKNISRFFFSNIPTAVNCYVESHFNSKLLIRASRLIEEGQILQAERRILF